MRSLTILLTIALAALTVLDLTITFRTGRARDMWGNISTATNRPDRYWRNVYRSCAIFVLCVAFVLWELIQE
jgi:hypothetical protein